MHMNGVFIKIETMTFRVYIMCLIIIAMVGVTNNAVISNVRSQVLATNREKTEFFMMGGISDSGSDLMNRNHAPLVQTTEGPTSCRTSVFLRKSKRNWAIL